jgi:short-subunit dehydrogenase
VSEASVAIFAEEVAKAFDGIDVLINAAGSGYVRSLGMMRMSMAVMPLLRRAAGQRLIVNVASVDGFAITHRIFPYAGSAESFQRLSDALKEQTKGSSIEVVALTPQMRPGGRPEPATNQLYRLLQVDEDELAERVVALVRARRPGWRIRRRRENRRA